MPGFQPATGIRVIPLPDFKPVNIGVIWSARLSPIAQHFLAELETEAKKLNASAGG